MDVIIKNKAYYLDHYQELTQLPIFYKPHFIDAVCDADSWEVVVCVDKSDTIRAIMPYHLKKKFGFYFILTPKLIPYFGPLIFPPEDMIKPDRINTFGKQMVDILHANLPQHLAYKVMWHPSIIDWQALMWKSYKQTTRYSYILNTLPSIDQLWSNLKSEVRNNIKKADQELELIENLDVDSFYDLCLSSYRRQNIMIPFSLQEVKSIYEALSIHKEVNISAVKNVQKNQLEAAVMVVSDSSTSYGLLTGKLEDAHRGAVSMVLWHCIQQAKSQSKKYDFCGSDVQQIEPLFRSFGSTQTPYFSVYKATNKWIDIALQISNKF